MAIFFVISGFIMAYTTRNKFGSASSVANFSIHRFVRVVPLYWLYTLVAAALIMTGAWLKGRDLQASEIAKSLLFIPYSTGGAMRPVLGQGWTLNYEVFFYGIFALALFFPRRIGLTLVAGLLLSLATIGAFWGPFWLGGDALTIQEFYISPHVALFAVGIAIGNLAIRGPSLRVARHWLWFTLGTIGAMTAIFAMFSNAYHLPLPVRITFWAADALIVLLCVLDRDQDPNTPFAKLCETLGDASYSIYLVHFFIVTVVAKIWSLAFEWRMPALYVVSSVCAGVAGGYFAWRFVEVPLTAWLKVQAELALGKPARPATVN